MRLLTIAFAAVLAGMLTMPAATPAQAAPQELGDALVANELRTLARSIDNLARQMEKQSAGTARDTTLRKLDLAIAYLNFRSRRIEMFERELQSTRSNRNRLDDALENFQREEESLSRSFDGNHRESMQKAREELSLRRKIVKDRISRLDEEIVLLENRIMDMQSQIDSVESFVQKNLVF